MTVATVIAIAVLGFVLGTLKTRYNFGSRQEVLRLFNHLSPEFHAHAFDDLARRDKQTPFRPFRFAR